MPLIVYSCRVWLAAQRLFFLSNCAKHSAAPGWQPFGAALQSGAVSDNLIIGLNMRNRYFSADPAWNRIAVELYDTVADLPLVCPHGHVDPRLFADPDYRFGSPVDLLIIPDHYVFRMLYSRGIRLESLGIEPLPGAAAAVSEPSGGSAIIASFGRRYAITGICSARRRPASGCAMNWRMSLTIKLKLNGANAQPIYDAIAEKLERPDYRPRALYERFNIEVLATTDAATDTLEQHQLIRASGWKGRIIPTFRPDAVINIDTPGWRENIKLLSDVSGVTVGDYGSYLQALEQRRAAFKAMGATATDHAAATAYTEALSAESAAAIFQRALRGQTTAKDCQPVSPDTCCWKWRE